MEESEQQVAAQAAAARARLAGNPLAGFAQGLRLVRRNRLFMKLCACNMLYGVAAEGLEDLLQ